ncbi:hypothetical protein GH714_007289 [Hevea brasiliensis]|uniref:Uncharacterized protein n=1 Tax=Hevea brasiliensis TaxID=3981 RepID=A0A6A6L9B0_HEVBR|nr:hypothetical protein GH714_007289 [Hevea brasiliensis]
MLETVKYLMGSAGSSGFGSKSTADQVTAGADLRSITAIITGATSGIGAETARVLAKHGARLAAATTCYVAAHPRLSNVSGKYFADCNEASSTSKLGSSSTEAARLWSASEIMVSRDPKAVFDPLNATTMGHKEK